MVSVTVQVQVCGYYLLKTALHWLVRDVSAEVWVVSFLRPTEGSTLQLSNLAFGFGLSFMIGTRIKHLIKNQRALSSEFG